MDCKHEMKLLEGRADGIHCKGCGKVFKSLAEINKVEIKEEKTITKKGGKK